MMPRPLPDSLLLPGLAQIWQSARQRLDKFGAERRGSIACPNLDAASSQALRTLLGHKPRSRVDLLELEQALVARDVGADLCAALSRLGQLPSEAAVQRRANRTRLEAARAALVDRASDWEEPWAKDWASEIASAGQLRGLTGEVVENLADDVRHLLDHLNQVSPAAVSRTEVAATLFGSSHALDPGTKLASFTTRALRHRWSHSAQTRQLPEPGQNADEPASDRELWETSGILADRVSAPVLLWSLPVTGSTALDQQINAATGGRLALHISLAALQRHPVQVPAGTHVLVVENPRLVEAAAERSLPACVISSNGNPTTAVTTLVQQLSDSEASIWYHGDFDSYGLSICRRIHDFGCTPWMMDAEDYADAIRLAKERGVQLEADAHDCGPTPWDPVLQAEFAKQRLIVHEEFILDWVLERFGRLSTRSSETP